MPFGPGHPRPSVVVRRVAVEPARHGAWLTDGARRVRLRGRWELCVPRERYDSGVRERAGKLLADAFGGRVSAYYPSFSDAPLARVHFIVGVTPGDHREPDMAALEDAIAETARTWEDRFEAAIRDGGAPGRVAETLARYAGAFPPGYRDQYDAAEALADIEVVDALGADEAVRVRAFRRDGDSPVTFRFKLYRPGAAAPPADVLPILEHMGLKALIEDGHKVSPSTPDGERSPVWVHEFILRDEQGEHLAFADVKLAFEAAFVAIWTGRAESDGFNRLVLELGIGWREAALIRALARYRQQSGLDPSQGVQEQALADHPGVARLVLDLFQTKFDPAVVADLKDRQVQAKAVEAKISEALQAVESLDADRVLRRIAALVGAIQRTNFYQPGEDGQPKPYISFKIASRELEDLPAPKPYREIFISAPHIEGVHLRFGPVARGGLRWSDRRDDFRTEVLGLVKAQQVKNAVIVPVGSKGGFYPKQLPRGGDRDAIQAEAIRAYKTFLFGLLDITDNLDAKGKVIRPEGVIAHDGESNPVKALQFLDLVPQSDAHYSQALQFRIELLYGLGRENEAVALMEQGKRLFPGQSRFPLLRRRGNFDGEAPRAVPALDDQRQQRS